MKRPSRLETVPQPISLNARKHSAKFGVGETPPYRIDWESPNLRAIDNHVPISSASLISNMKQELSSIKLDVEKLINSEEPLESKLTQKLDIFNQSLKDELAYQKKVEEQLRKEIRELKLKLSDPKPREERLAFERKLEELKADKFKSDRERDTLQERVAKLQAELAEAQRLSQTKDEVKSGKFQQLMREFEKVQTEKKRLQAQNTQLQLEPKSVEKVDRQVQASNSEEHMKLRNGMHELEKQKLVLAGRLHEKEEELGRTTSKYQTSLKETEAKYYNAIAEFRSLEEQLRTAKIEEVGALNRRVESLESEVSELARVNLQLCQQNDELTIRSSKKEIEPSSHSESLRRQNGELMAVVAKLKQAYQLQQTENDQLQGKLTDLRGEMDELQTVEVENLRQQITVLEDNMLTLQSNYERRLRESDEASRDTKLEYMEKMSELAVGKKLAEEEIEVLRRKIQQAYTEYLLGKESESAVNKAKPKLVDFGVQSAREAVDVPKPIAKAAKHNLGTQTIRVVQSVNSSQTEVEAGLGSSIGREEEEELHSLRVESVNLALQINQLNKDILGLGNQLRAANEFSRQKDLYIVELERQKEILEAGDCLREMEQKCLQLAEEHSKVIEDYELKIMRLEKEVDELREKNMRRSRASSVHTQDTTSFDEALKLQLHQNDQLKHCLRQKQEEMLELRAQMDEWRRKAESLRTQTEIDKLRGVSEQKTMKSQYDISIQNLKSEIESQRRKQETLQRKVQFKCDELRKKDQFIQQVIIGKLGRDAQQSQLEFTKKELERLFTANYSQRLFGALERIHELEQKILTAEPMISA